MNDRERRGTDFFSIPLRGTPATEYAVTRPDGTGFAQYAELKDIVVML